MDSINFPIPPNNNGQNNSSMYMSQAYTTDGKPVQTETIPPAQEKDKLSIGANFSKLIGTDVRAQIVPIGNTGVVTEKPKRKKKVVTKDPTKDGNDVEVIDPTNSRQVVENTVYADSYAATNKMAYNIIAQSDDLLRDCKQDLDFIRSQRNLKGKYHYTNATLASMSSLLNTKLAAVKEINNTIKSVNDMEYRRFKDMRAIDQGDDTKALMDAYNAYISAPVGGAPYSQPNTMEMTAGLDGVIRADMGSNVTDQGMANYLANLSPEENLMLHDNNPNIEEVIVYDEASGAKYFQWVDKRTDTPIPNMPASSELALNDYSVDVNRRIAKNNNLNTTKRVIIKNSTNISRF